MRKTNGTNADEQRHDGNANWQLRYGRHGHDDGPEGNADGQHANAEGHDGDQHGIQSDEQRHDGDEYG